MFPVNIFRVNETSMELVRDANGLCIPVKAGELGMIMGKVRNDVLSRFEGELKRLHVIIQWALVPVHCISLSKDDKMI